MSKSDQFVRVEGRQAAIIDLMWRMRQRLAGDLDGDLSSEQKDAIRREILHLNNMEMKLVKEAAQREKAVEPEAWLSLSEAAARLNISRRALRDLADAGKVPCLRLRDGRGYIRRFQSDSAEKALLKLAFEEEAAACGSQ